MLLDHSLQNGQLRNAHRLILFPPVRIETKGGKRAIDARFAQKLVSIGCLNDRYHHQARHSTSTAKRMRIAIMISSFPSLPRFTRLRSEDPPENLIEMAQIILRIETGLNLRCREMFRHEGIFAD